MLSAAAASQITRLLGKEVVSYHSFNFALLFPPALITGHLGQLTLTNPYQLLAAVIEVGPVLLALPLLFWWGLKAFRAQRWYEAVLTFSSFLGLAFVFVQFSGEAGPTALIRFQSLPFTLAGYVVLPILWLWAAHYSPRIKIILAALLSTSLVGGLVLLTIQMIAIPRPVSSYSLTDLDTLAARDYWDKLRPGALVFDPNPGRAPILFGRFTDSSIDYFRAKPEWEDLKNNPDPKVWRAHGFTYVFLDQKYLQELTPEKQRILKQASCMQLIKEYKQSYPEDFRRLYDINRCQ